MSNGVFNNDFIENCTIVQLDQKGVTNGTLLGIMIVDAEVLLFNTVDLGPEFINAWVGRSRISTEERHLVIGNNNLE